MSRVKRRRAHYDVDQQCDNYWLTRIQNDPLFGGSSGIPWNLRLGSNDLYYRSIYKSFSVKRHTIYDPELDSISRLSHTRRLQPQSSTTERHYGGIYNVSFSPTGSVCAAATAKKAILLFDPLTHKRTSVIQNAHEDSVNYVKFINNDGLFASCSDDNAINLWDIRNMRGKVMHLTGHNHWIKNLEFDSKSRKLVSASYDGSVRVWDIFHDSGYSLSPNRDEPCFNDTVILLSGLMRMRLTHDNSKMVICTNEGYYLIVHDLNLDTVKQDLAGFHPDLYHLMQKGSPFHYDFGSWFNKLFTAKKNRVELISDFPPGVDGHHITSLDLHPSSWAILSRGITRNDDAEYTFVHDIQDDIKPTKLITMSIPTENNVTTYHNPLSRMAGFVQTHSDSISTVMASSPEPQDTMSPVIIISSQTPSRRPHATILNPQQISLEHRARRFIYKNEPRLTHYQKEANVGHGYIKELCFSPEGRVICSPFEFGFRLSSFDENFREMSRCRTRGEDGLISKPSELNVLKTILPHSDFVVTTKFSPTHLLIASGCLSGRLVFSMPCL